jgi:polyisoprenoid-binding protein YceI
MAAMNSRPLAALLVLATPCALAQTVLPDGSEIRFVSTQMGVPVEGRFTRWQAQLSFDPRQPQAAQVGFAIDTRSIAFGAADTEAEAAKPLWFDSARHPQALFRSTAVKALGGGRYEVAGVLTIKGRSHPLRVPVSLANGPGAGQGLASGSFTLARMDYRLGEGEWSDVSVVANEVRVDFKLRLAGLAVP